MKVLFLAAEATPFVKVGGLADVAGELPQALADLGIDIRLGIPLHPVIDRSQFELTEIARVELPRGPEVVEARLYETSIGGLSVWLIDGQMVEQVPRVYGDIGQDAEKYTFTSLAVLAMCEQMGWIPDILHAHDWHTAASVMRLTQLRKEVPAWRGTKSLYTVHNLPYMGAGAQATLANYGLSALRSPLLPEKIWDWPLPQGVLQADWVSTVSPTYAGEIKTSEFGAGLERLMESRQDSLSGIINGIDPRVWNPASDQALPQPFDLRRLQTRIVNKLGLQAELNLEQDARVPLIGLVSRLDAQKGMDLLWPAMDELAPQEWQLVLLGTGDPELEQISRDYAQKYPSRVKVIQQFDAALARRIYAGSDMLIIPSRYEPCGLAQMIAMRYGSIPIARATGGLVDTVTDVERSALGTGFLFEDPSSEALAAVMSRALRLYSQAEAWEQLQRRAMSADFSWERSAARYQTLYEHLSGIDVD